MAIPQEFWTVKNQGFEGRITFCRTVRTRKGKEENCSLQDFVDIIKQDPPLVSYEILNGSKKIKPYFDVDKQLDTEMTGEEIENHANKVVEYLTKIFANPKIGFAISNASRPGKLSLHVVCTGVYTYIEDVKRIVIKAKKEVPELAIDVLVYNRYRQLMRSVGSIGEKTDTRRLVPSFEEYKGSVEDHIIQVVFEDYERLDMSNIEPVEVLKYELRGGQNALQEEALLFLINLRSSGASYGPRNDRRILKALRTAGLKHLFYKLHGFEPDQELEGSQDWVSDLWNELGKKKKIDNVFSGIEEILLLIEYVQPGKGFEIAKKHKVKFEITDELAQSDVLKCVPFFDIKRIVPDASDVEDEDETEDREFPIPKPQQVPRAASPCSESDSDPEPRDSSDEETRPTKYKTVPKKVQIEEPVLAQSGIDRKPLVEQPVVRPATPPVQRVEQVTEEPNQTSRTITLSQTDSQLLNSWIESKIKELTDLQSKLK